MRSSLVSLVAALAAVAPVQAFDCSGPYFSFYNRGGAAMSYQRLDPALFPGVESPHLHSFDGGNGLVSNLTFADTQASTCTTVPIKLDKSLYWRPTLFFHGNDSGYYRVPERYSKVYYKFGDNNVRYNVSAFPKDFQMVAGNAMLRHNDTDFNKNGPQIYWRAKGTEKGDIDGLGGFPSGFTTATDFTAEIHFPTCWNGRSIDPAHPTAHMAYANGTGTDLDKCPEGFKVARFPEIFIEFWFDPRSFDKTYSASSVPWVLASGDPTGYGFHADFANGWVDGALANATRQNGYLSCGCGCGNDQYAAYFGPNNVYQGSDPEYVNCKPLQVEFPGDDVTPVQNLPGCNLLQSGPADATAVTGASCSATPASVATISAAAANAGPSAPMSSSAASSAAASSATSSASSTSSSKVSAAAAASSTAPTSAKTHTTVATHTAAQTVTAGAKHRRGSHRH